MLKWQTQYRIINTIYSSNVKKMKEWDKGSKGAYG